MNEGTIRQWGRVFKDGWTNVHNEERSGWSSVVSGELVQNVDQNICERQHFAILELSCEFPQISWSVLYEIITVGLGCHKFCAKWVPKMLTGTHKTESGFGFDFFRVIQQRCWWISQLHNMSNRWWTSGFHLWILKPKSSQNSGYIHIHQTSQRSFN
jgi:hypothetical protein